jgi:Tfp pilus assembly protein PilO
MWQWCNKHRKQILALMLFLGALGAVQVLWLQPIVDDTGALRDQLAREQGLIDKYQRKLEQAKGLSQQLQEQEKELKRVQQRLVQGKDPYQLAAALGELASGNKTEDLVIKSYQVLNTVEFGLYQEVRLKFNLATTISGLYRFLASLGSSNEAISFQELNVQYRRVRQGPDLSIAVVVAALMEKPKAGKVN